MAVQRRACAALLLLGGAAAASNRVVLGGYDVVEYFNLPKDANATMGTSDHKFTLTTHDYTQKPKTVAGQPRDPFLPM